MRIPTVVLTRNEAHAAALKRCVKQNLMEALVRPTLGQTGVEPKVCQKTLADLWGKVGDR